MRKTPLLQSQISVAIRWIAYPEMTQYNLPVCLTFPKRIGAARIREAVETVVAVRDIFRLRLTQDERGEVLQYIDNEMTVGVSHRALTDNEAREYIESGFVRPFVPFSDEPLVRFEVIEAESNDYLLVDFHHILADGASYAPVWSIHDLSAALRGEQLQPHSFSMLDYAEEEQMVLKSDAYARAKQYYEEKFRAVGFTDIADNRQSAWGNQIIASEFVPKAEVDKWCKSHDVAPNLLFMAAYGIVLSRFAGEENVAFCTLNHGRTDRRLRNIYGMFVRNAPVLADVQGDKTVLDFVREQRRELMATVRYGAYPITHFCKDLNTAVATVFAFQGEAMQEFVFADNERIEAVQLPHGLTEEDLACMIYTVNSDYEIRLTASDALHPLSRLTAFAHAVLVCVRNIMRNPKAKISELQIIDYCERELLIELGTGRKTECDESETFIDLFLKQVAKTPDNVAVVDEYGSLTYAELDALSREYSKEISAGRFLTLETHRTKDYLVRAIGIMRAGSAFVPLDHNLPSDRCAFIVDDAKERRGEGFAYMIYTSGTTGQPKGVMITHRALANLVRFVSREWQLTERSRISCHSSFAFDASIEDLFPVLTVGGAVYIVPEEVRMDLALMRDYICKHGITGGCYTTQFGQLLLKHYPDLPVDYLVVGGEKMTINPPCRTRLINTYGPTEFAVDATFFELENGKEYENIPIGRPIDNTCAYILDSHGNMLPRGVVGELCLEGVQRDSYRTGDLCRWNEDGQLEFFGRKDFQVKLRGYRIELAEIETVALKMDVVEQTVAEVREINGAEHLVLFVVWRCGALTTSIKPLGNLPSYMQPSYIIQLDKLPLTPSGKIDRKALPDGEELLALCEINEGRLPQTETEQLLCQLFADILGTDSYFADADFFLSGGTSMLAIQLVMEAHKRGLRFTYKNIFDNPTPQQLAAKIDGMSETIIDGMSEARIDGVSETISDMDISDYDYAAIDKLLAQESAETAHYESHFGDCLLFGATGFLGIHVLFQLLHDYDAKVCCVIRAENEASAWERLADIYRYYHNEELDKERVRVKIADIADSRSFRNLADVKPDVVINCAANVKHFAKGTEIEDVNYLGVLNIIDYCKRQDCRLVHASTISVAGFVGKKTRKNELTERDLFIGQSCSENKYVLSKFLAERAVLQAVADGLKGKIVRLGNLSPRATDGRFQLNPDSNSFLRTFRGFARAGIYPKEILSQPVHLEPVDDSARALLLFAQTPKDRLVLNCCNPQSVTYGDILSAMQAEGLALNGLEMNEFVCKTESLDDEARSLLLTNVVAYGIDAKSLSERVKINSEHSERMLANLGFVWNRVGESYLRKFIATSL